ncbi:hypothetical protein GCM10009119_07630 [Algoriphagus jejuensis]|uniref:Histidine kinase N-terminal 7TM region domain-containing protein n=1 Tax=Algoriphagus jejuensis TaxID=419934 RepID=A0ABN1MXH9_9BACT
MDQINLDRFYERLNYYPLSLIGIALIGLLGYSLLSAAQRKNEAVRLSLGIVVLVASYEFFAGFLASQKIVNNWVYNLFNSHVSAILFFLLLRSFLKRKNHKKWVSLLIVFFLLISLILHSSGFVHYNDSGEYILFLNSVLMLGCCGLYFFELMTLDEFLEIDPLKEFSFWATTATLFYFSSSFMIYISYEYLYTHHLDICNMVIEIPRNMSILSNFLLCFGIYSVLISDRFQIEIIHV